MEADLWYGRKRYNAPRRRKAPSAPQPLSFTERKAGDDPVQDIIDAGACLRSAHPHYKDAPPLGDGGARAYWALMLEAMRKVTGLTLDEVIERIRERDTKQTPPAGDDCG